MALVLYRATRPRVTVLGRAPEKPDEFIDVERHPEVEQVAGIVILRLEAALFYANANEIRRAVEAEVEKRSPPPRGVLLDLGATGYVDLTSIDVLVELVRELREQSIPVILVHVLGKVRDLLREAGVMEEIGESNIVNNLSVGVHLLAERARYGTPGGQPKTGSDATGATDV